MISGISGEDFLAGARTISGEADNQPYEGKVAIACVLINRLIIARDYKAKHPGKTHPTFGDGSLYNVCHAPYQFSAWLEADPNRKRMLEMVPPSAFGMSPFRDSVEALASVLSSRAGPNPASQASHYHEISIMPSWANGLTPLCTIARHVFYNTH